MNRIVLSLLLSVALTAGVHAGPGFEEGAAAYHRGDYNSAAQRLIPLAETADDALAQYYLGVMYAEGKGVEQSMEQAARWYRSAAEKGVASAQYRLGILYRDGSGLPQDLENAYAWFSVASKLGSSKAPVALSSLDGKLSAEEMTGAQKLAEEYIEKYGQPPKSKPEGLEAPIKQQ